MYYNYNINNHSKLVSTKKLYVNPLFYSRIFQNRFLRLKPIYNKSRHNVQKNFKYYSLGKSVGKW